MQKLVYLVSAILALSTFTACTRLAPMPAPLPESPGTNSSIPTATPVDSTTKQPSNSSKTSQSRPPTKTVKDEWTQQPLIVKRYDSEGIPFSTYFLESDFIVEQADSGEGTGVWFYSKVEGKKEELAYVHFFFPARPATIEQMRRGVIGKRGLMETNKWQVKGRSQDVPFSWAKERIDFERPFNAQNNIMGTVYIGEYNGKAFRATVHYPADYGDGFAPRASIILNELQVGN